MNGLQVLKSLLGLAGAGAAGFAVWTAATPSGFAHMLRRRPDGPPEFPEDYEQRLSRVKILRDLVYPSAYGRNRVDLYLPVKREKPVPVIVWVHGGSFVAGVKESVENWTASLASEGAAVAAVEYQWSPEAHWPAQVLQIGECCRFLCENAADYGLDMQSVIIAGDSAGAHMAAQFALLHSSEAFRERSGLRPVLKDGALKGAMLYCGPYELGGKPVQNRKLRFFIDRVGWCYLGRKDWRDSKEAELCTIKNYVTPQFPPAYITDGNTFSFEPHGRALAVALRAQQVPVQERFFPPEYGQVTHGYRAQMRQPCARACYEDTLRFLKDRNIL